MKKHLTLFLLLLCALTATAQEYRSFQTPDGNHIKQLCNSNPESIRSLVRRVATPNLATPPTTQECVLAYFGSSYINHEREQEFLQKMLTAIQKGEQERSLMLADEVLSVNPVNLTALIHKGRHIPEAASDVPARDISKNSLEGMRIIGNRILDAIATTGDGTEAHPFFVASNNDANYFMKYRLHKKGAKSTKVTVLHLNSIQTAVGNCYNRSTTSLEVQEIEP